MSIKDIAYKVYKELVPFNFSANNGISGINCVMRLGLPGSGKTLDQTEKDVLFHLLNGEEVWSCYWINWNGDNLHYFSEFEEVENLRNVVVVFDEIGQILPAREWEKEGLRVQLFFQLHRHRHVDIIGNTQDVSLVAKTVGIVANSWILCEKANIGILDFLLGLLDLKSIMIRKTEMTYQGLKKMANGWEVNQTISSPEKSKLKWYSVEKISHKELEEFKVEIVHRYCPKCAMRQGEQILKEDTASVCDYDTKKRRYTLKFKEICPKHQDTQLEIRESGIYDTDHEPELKEKEITFQPMIDIQAGAMKVKYNGRMSKRQTEEKSRLEREYNK